MPLNLAELVVLIQDQIQKSFEYGEHMSTIGRNSDQSDLRISVSEAEIELPIKFTVDEVGISSGQLKKLITDGNSIDIANKLLSLPSLSKELEFLLKDRMTIDRITREVNNAQPEREREEDTETRRRTSEDEDLTLPEVLTEIHAERIKNFRWEELRRRKFASLQVANLTPNGVAAEEQENFSGRISLKFKAVVK